MKKIRQLSFRAQIFLSSMLLVIIPTIVLSTVNAMQRAASITAEYNTSAAATLTQMNQALDTLIENAVNVADTPLLNDDAGQAMVTNYETDYLSYAQDSTLFRNLMRQTNRLNSTIQAVYFLNRYGYSFEYNLSTAQQRLQIEENINRWADIARSSKNRTCHGRRLGKQRKHIPAEAVRAGRNAHADSSRICDRLKICRAQTVNVTVGVAVRLKIRNHAVALPLRGELPLSRFDLRCHCLQRRRYKVAAPTPRAVNTAAIAASAVDVRAGAADVQCHLQALSAEGAAQVVIIGIISLVRVAVGKGIARLLCRFHRRTLNSPR